MAGAGDLNKAEALEDCVVAGQFDTRLALDSLAAQLRGIAEGGLHESAADALTVKCGINRIAAEVKMITAIMEENTADQLASLLCNEELFPRGFFGEAWRRDFMG